MAITSVEMTEDEYNFVKSQGLKFSDLMRNAIFEKKQILSGAIVDNVQEEKRKRESFQRECEKLKEFLEHNKLTDEYLKWRWGK